MKLGLLRPTGRTLRALVAVGIVGLLIVLLLAVRAKLNDEEKRATYVMSALSWKLSETLLESQKLLTAFVGYEAGSTTRNEVIVATELLWSRTGVLINSEFNDHKSLIDASNAFRAFLEKHEAAVYDAPSLTPEQVSAMRAELSVVANALREVWIRDYLGDRSRIHATATRDIANARTLFERLIMGCVLLLAIYMIVEIRGAQRAQVRERALREQALSASEAKTHFLANVSHEIRTPLNGVVGMVQELRETQLTDEQRNMMGVIQSSSELLLGTINDVLDIAKIEAGRLTLENVAFSPADQVRLSADLYQPAIRDKGLKLDLDIADLPVLQGDPLRFSQVVNNLVSNAVKFTSRGRVRIALSASEEASDGTRRVCVSVKDSGAGIPPDAIAAIFQPFSQADSSTTRTHGGTGLGLTISRAICREFGGDIEVSTELGQGSTFVATFRLQAFTAKDGAKTDDARGDVVPSIATDVRVSDSKARPIPKIVASKDERGCEQNVFGPSDSEKGTVDRTDVNHSVSSDEPRVTRDRDQAKAVQNNGPSGLDETGALPLEETRQQASRTILLVDDSSTNRIVMKRFLKTLDAEIHEAENGHDAVQRAMQTHYDLILMDIQMPVMDGIEATMEIRAHEDADIYATRVPIIAVTANVMSHQVDTYLARGIDRVVAKPVRKVEILGVIDQLCPVPTVH